jgi:hypothetical protein
MFEGSMFFKDEATYLGPPKNTLLVNFYSSRVVVTPT